VIGKRLRQAREAAGMTQRTLAIEAGITINTVSELERDVQDNPSLKTLQAVAEVLRVPVSQLLGEEARAS
jgi:XRE family transcriptional regulator of biofilm formation